MKTWNAKPGEVDRKWWLVDATDKTVGRLATEVAKVIRGKNKPEFTPHVDAGDFVVVVNTDKMKFSGNKLEEKKYYTRSRFFGSLKEKAAQEWMSKDSTHIFKTAVKGMLPKSRLGRKLTMKLKAYPTAEHPHAAQKPEALNI